MDNYHIIFYFLLHLWQNDILTIYNEEKSLIINYILSVWQNAKQLFYYKVYDFTYDMTCEFLSKLTTFLETVFVTFMITSFPVALPLGSWLAALLTIGSNLTFWNAMQISFKCQFYNI